MKRLNLSHLIYRPEIDGLRAIAIIPVILFHVGLTVFSGGYVGVDVFFVISGYLITAILITELEEGDFSIARFYERRARRILPALFFVILCCIPFAWMWMLPTELKDFSQSIVAVVFFASNILFWREDGYFAPAADLKPLLHTWSLAVEEQYYLLFPLFLLLMWRFGRNSVFWAICCAAAFSLLLSEWGWRNNPSANFYLAPTRAWELLAGSICAFWLSGRNLRASNWLSFAGLGLIVFAIFNYDQTTAFPSVYALAPVLGAALIILFGRAGTWTAKLLSTRGLVGIGLISYSAYLWHQPLFAFARIRSMVEPPPELMMALAALSVGLGYLSWRYIEKPFRKGHVLILPTRRAVFAASGVSASVLLVLGLTGHFHDGFALRSRGRTNLANLEERLIVNHGLSPACEDEFKRSTTCQTSKRPSVLLWGDSYAMHLVQGIQASDPRVKLQQHTKSSCSPILGVAPIEGRNKHWGQGCIAFNDSVLNWLSQHDSVDLVILSSSFSSVTTGTFITRDGREYQSGDMALVRNAIIETAGRIRNLGPRVLIVSPTPSSGINNGICSARASFFGSPYEMCNFSFNPNQPEFIFLSSIEKNIPIYWLADSICLNGSCKPMRDDVFIYRDAGHLSKEGSEYLGRTYKWMEQFRSIAR